MPVALLNGMLLGMLGLLIGSFLNVVVYRLPKMMEAQWEAECADLQKATPPAPKEPFNLMVPRSRCQNCGHPIQWYENVPVLSYVALRGKCSSCSTPIGIRYPLVELATGALFFFCGWHWGLNYQALAWSGFAATLLGLALIDWDTTLLPDVMTLPLMWAGILLALLGLPGAPPLAGAVLGAVVGYMVLWLVYWAFKLATGKEGMGHGDFKLLAALGAWFGWQGLLPLILMASIVGVVVGVGLKITKRMRQDAAMPFGPFLAGAGFCAMFFNTTTLLRLLGIA